MNVNARAAVPIVADVKESFSERHANHAKLPMGVIKVYSVFVLHGYAIMRALLFSYMVSALSSECCFT